MEVHALIFDMIHFAPRPLLKVAALASRETPALLSMTTETESVLQASWWKAIWLLTSPLFSPNAEALTGL